VMSDNIVQGGAPGSGNVDVDPKFAETTRFTLKADSPAKRAASDGKGRVELGAYGRAPLR
jgi:hypothetical protein